jgi:hypothetical protein
VPHPVDGDFLRSDIEDRWTLALHAHPPIVVPVLERLQAASCLADAAQLLGHDATSPVRIERLFILHRENSPRPVISRS